MPKGVEHSNCVHSFDIPLSVESLMPKGVEHCDKALCNIPEYCSVESLMPKGVEHKRQVLIMPYLLKC